jgi:hypothetical protein
MQRPNLGRPSSKQWRRIGATRRYLRVRAGEGGNQRRRPPHFGCLRCQTAGPKEVQTIYARYDAMRHRTSLPALFVCRRCKGFHGTQQPGNLSTAGNRFRRVAPVFQRVLVPFGAPVDFPPCSRQFGIAVDWHGLPLRFHVTCRGALDDLLCKMPCDALLADSTHDS